MTRIIGSIAALMVLLLAVAVGTNANDVILTNNTGTTSTRWFITGEPSLVINGFDLRAKSVAVPTTVTAIRISVRRAMPGNPVEALVYEDADGGSPQNARLLKRQTVDITTTGVYTVTFDQPVTVTQPFLWVGFYLPVDFEFFADTSGSSQLTYWGWTPGTVFDLNNLASAQVLGPANGTAPVNLDMKGIARITAEIETGAVAVTTTPDPSRITQIVGDPATSLAPMVKYTNCQRVTYDTADIGQTYQNGVKFDCKQVPQYLEPADPTGYARRGGLFDVAVFGVPSGLSALPYPVTHCIDANENLDNRAVIGLAQGAPRQWQILPTVRYGTVVCAELTFSGFISVFVPR
jgi:hypothetical protein